MHEVAPRAVTIADAIEAINCTINFTVSFFVIALIFFRQKNISNISRCTYCVLKICSYVLLSIININ